MANTEEGLRQNRSRSWWKQRTRMEKTSVILLVIAIAIIIALIIGIAVVARKSKSKAESAKPCDDFYEFACGRYVKETHLPEDKTNLNSLVVIQDRVNQQLKTILEEPIKPKEPKPFVLTKKFYNICMNTSAIEADGLNTVRRILKQLGGWPVLEGWGWNGNDFDWKTSIYKFRQHGIGFADFIHIDTTYDSKNSTLRILLIDQPQPDMAEENLIGGLRDDVVKTYYEYMVDLAELFGANRATAENDVKSMINFRVELAKITLSDTERGDVTTLYNPMTIAELQSKYGSIQWLEFIRNIVNRPNVKVTSDEILNIKAPDYLTSLVELLQKTPKRDQANYVFFRSIRNLIPYLPENIKAREKQFVAAFSEVPGKSPRWMECVEQVSTRFKEALGSLYVRKYFHESSKEVIGEMVSDIRKELVKNIKNVDWIDEDTRKIAIDKALAIKTHIGYPVEFLDDKELEKHYAELNFTSNNYLAVTNQIVLFATNADYGQLHDPINKTDWRMRASIIEINAAYLPQENSIQLPAGILQGPFYENDRPHYMNYGGMGYVIGHEITHGFDTTGKQFDKIGNFENWWAEKTDNAFKEKSKCLIKQYGDIVEPEIGKNLNGEKTIGENIADNGGVKEAYLAYNSWLERNGPELTLPGLNYTAKQLFWISAASCWCVKQTKKTIEDLIDLDEHSLAPYRIRVPFGNTEYFAKDFNCPLGSKMNPKHKCEIW